MKRPAFLALALLSLVAGLSCFYAHRHIAGQRQALKSQLPAGAPVLASRLVDRSDATSANQINSGLEQQPPPAAGTGKLQPGQGSARVSHAETPKRPWDPNFLAHLSHLARGDKLQFELVGQWASGMVQHTEHSQGELIYVTGPVLTPEPGRYFFQKQTRPGMAGEFVGVVEFAGSKTAYRLEPSGPGGASELVQRPLAQVVCLNLPPCEGQAKEPEEIPPLKPQDFPTVPIPDYQNGIVVLESLPGAIAVLYLDYQGGYTPTWGGITYAKPTANNTEIREVWKRVAEDYMPFNINVTTDWKVFQNAPPGSRQRVIVTPTTTAAPGTGGVAYIGSFNWTGETPCWAFYATGKTAAEAISHEAGHTFGLSHDGKTDGTKYYGGQGSGETGWAPIMGVGYYQNVTEWSNGEYANANNVEDDLNIITTRNNNVTYRPDDTGTTLDTSRYLELYSNYNAWAEGVIERTGDTDGFQFTAFGGNVSLRADPVGAGPNLALQLALYDTNGVLLASNNPQNVLYAAIDTNLPAGTYLFTVTGAGRNNPTTDGFSSYGSLGYYTVTGMVANALLPNRFAIPENTPSGYVVGVIPAHNPNSAPLTYTISSGNLSNAITLDNLGQLTVANSALLDYETLARGTVFPVQFEMLVDIINTVDFSLTERNRRVVVAVTNVNEPPSGLGFSATVLEHTLPGTAVGTVTGSDPDFWTLLSYSIAGGNNNGMFSIETNSGLIRVAGDLNLGTQSVYNLSVVLSDRTPPAPLTFTTLVSLTVAPNNTPFGPGTISYAVYTNINGTQMSNLSNAPAFPYDPAWEKQLPLFEGDSNRGDSFGAALRGFLIPPATGSYIFWIASDDNSELLLSSSTNVAGAVRVAYISGNNNYSNPREWTKYSNQQSAPIFLTGGQAYYIEAHHKDGSGNDHVAVAWQCASAGIGREVIPGRFVAPFFMNYTPHVTGFAYNLHRDALMNSRIGPVTVTDVNTNDDHTFEIISGNTGLIFSMDAASGYLRVASETLLQGATTTNYSLQVRATDNGTPPRSGTNTVTIKLWPADAITTAALQQEIWTGLGTGTSVSNLTSQAKYPGRPDVLRPLPAFATGENYADGYGSRIRGVLVPTNTGSYTFFIASDDNSVLKWSSNSDPADGTQIAAVTGWTDYLDWTKFSSQTSEALSLVAGQAYYLEALQKEDTGGDHLEVGWTGPGLTGTNVITNAFLRPVDLNYAPELSNKSALVSINVSNGAFVTSLTALDSPLDFLTYKIVSGNSNDTFALEPDTGRVTVADNTAIGNYLVAAFSLGVQVQDSGYRGLYPLQATPAVLSVTVLNNLPAFTWTGAGTNDAWSTAGNWQGTVPPENSKLVFAGTSRRTNDNDLLTQVGPVALNNGGFLICGNPVTMLAGLSSIGDNVWGLDSALNKPQSFTNFSGTLTIAGAVANNGYAFTLQVSNVVRLDAPVFGAGGLVKSGPGTLFVGARNWCTGPTVLTGGTLVVGASDSLASSQSLELHPGTMLKVDGLPEGLTVPPTQTVVGEGTMVGSMVSYGTVSPGLPLGKLQVSRNLFLLGQTVMEIQKSGSILTNDCLQAGGRLVYGGSLLVTHTGEALAVGDSFRLFAAAGFSNAFAHLQLPSLPSELAWDLSQLQANGSIQVASLPRPQVVPKTGTGAQFLLQFPSALNHQYILEATWDIQPPILWIRLSTNAGTGGVMEISAPVEQLQTNRFFRMQVE